MIIEKMEKLLTPEYYLCSQRSMSIRRTALIADRYADVLTNLVDIAKSKVRKVLTKLKVFIRQMNGLRK